MEGCRLKSDSCFGVRAAVVVLLISILSGCHPADDVWNFDEWLKQHLTALEVEPRALNDAEIERAAPDPGIMEQWK